VLAAVTKNGLNLKLTAVATQPYMSDAGSKGTPLSPAVNDRVCAAGTVIKATFGDVPYADPSYDEVHDATQEGCVPDAPRA